MAWDNKIPSEDVENYVFGEAHKNFRGPIERCQTITFPIRDDTNGHWFICTIMLEAWKLLITDTCRDPKLDVDRMRKAIYLVSQI